MTRILTSSLVAVAIAVSSALALAWVNHGLGIVSSTSALILGVIVGSFAWCQTPHNKISRPTTFWEWLVIVVFTLASARAFLWLIYNEGDLIKVLSPNNLGDLSLHLTFIRYLARVTHWWPVSPILLQEPLRYPLGMDFFNSLLLWVGVPIERGLIWSGLIGALLTGLALWRWGGAFVMAAFLFNGGLGGVLLWKGVDPDTQVQWKNLFLSMFVTQRGLLYAIPVGLLLLTSWRESLDFFRNFTDTANCGVAPVLDGIVSSPSTTTCGRLDECCVGVEFGLGQYETYSPASKSFVRLASSVSTASRNDGDEISAPGASSMLYTLNSCAPSSPCTSSVSASLERSLFFKLSQKISGDYKLMTKPMLTGLPIWIQVILLGAMPLFSVHSFLFLGGMMISLIFHPSLLRKSGRMMDPALGSGFGLRKKSCPNYCPAPKSSPALSHQPSRLPRYESDEVSGIWLFFFVSPIRKSLFLLAFFSWPLAIFSAWLVSGGGVGGHFMGWHFGWMQEEKGWVAGFWFWLWNFGIALPLICILIFQLLFRSGRNGGEIRVHQSSSDCSCNSTPQLPSSISYFPSPAAAAAPIAFVLPAALAFLACCFFRFAPWPWDNMKLMMWSWLTIAPFLWHHLIKPRSFWLRALLCFLLFGSGAVTLLVGLDGRHGYEIAKRSELATTEALLKDLSLSDVIATAAECNHPVLLLGHPVAAGYEGHLWSHGLAYQERWQKVHSIMMGEEGWETKARSLGIHAIYWSACEQQAFPHSQLPFAEDQKIPMLYQIK